MQQNRPLRCLIWFLLLTFLLLTSCVFIIRRKADRSDTAPVSPENKAIEQKLTEAAIQFLASSPSTNPLKYEKRRRIFEAALAEYLHATGGQKQVKQWVKIHRDSITVVLPVQIVASDHLHSEMTRGDPPRAHGEIVQTSFNGEILDLAWLPNNAGSSGQIIALFADSLVSFHWPGNNGSTLFVHRFVRDPFQPIHAAPPAGVLNLLDLDLDQSPEVIALTSSIKSAVVFQQKQNQLSPMDAVDLPKDEALPSSWRIEPGGDMFGSLLTRRPAFRSLRRLPDTPSTVMLDATGHLRLFSENRAQPTWRSTRPYGNRLFLLPPNEIAVCDSRQSAFAVFRLVDQSLQPLGQSATFRGHVSALLSIRSENKDGLVIGTVFTDGSGQPTSHLQFFPRDSLKWMLPISLAQPQFPDHEAHLTFLQEASSQNFSVDWHLEYPPLVWRNIFETLYYRDEDGELQPFLASGIEVDSTWREWEIHLRHDIRFADGSPLTAQIVCESWKRNWFSCKRSSCTLQWLWMEVAGANDFVNGKRAEIQGLQVVDEHTLKVTLNVPQPNFIEHLAQPCFSVMKVSAGGKPLLGTGPFQIISTKHDQSGSLLQCRRNPYYHEGQSPLQEVRFVFPKVNVTEVLLSLEDAGATIRRKKDVAFFQRIDKTEVHSLAAQPVYFLALNPSVKALSSASQRRHVASALDREVLSNIIDAAECVAATDFFTTPITSESSPSSNSSYKAGVPLNISFRAQDEVAQQIAERLAARFSQLHIPCTAPQSLSDNAFEHKRRKGKYDILIDSYVPVFETALYNLAQLLQRGYVVDAAAVSSLKRALASAFSDGVADLEKMLVDEAVLHPVLRAGNYAVLPAGLKEARLFDAHVVDFGKAWLPLRE